MTETTALPPRFSTEMVHDNERIVITPPDLSWNYMGSKDRTHAELVRDLEEMRTSILRHVDGATQRNVAVEWDSKTCCTHCKEPVELACDDNGVPYCCDAAQAEWTASGGTLAP